MHSIRFKIISVSIAAILVSILSLGLIGIYTVQLQSNRNAVEKLDLMSEYNLAGVGGWRLGQVTSDVWPLINAYVSEE